MEVHGTVIYVQEHLSILIRNANRSFLVSTWYRPPNSSTDVFDAYNIFLLNRDAENKEPILLY